MERYSVKTSNASSPNRGNKKDLRQSRIGSSSSMDSTNSSSMYRKSYPSSDINASFSSSVAGSIQDDTMNDQCSLTQAELEEYSRSYFGQQVFHHQKQSSYAQSEGYHSYVSSSDSSSATPFLDRLRQESELLSRSSHWSQSDLQSASSANNITENNSSESTSSSETLKWLGSMSDVSVSSHATNSSNISGSGSSSQLIVHSSRVRTPKRHNSESVLYMTEEQIATESKQSSPRERSSRSNNRLFPISTYTEPTSGTSDSQANTPTKSQNGNNNNWQSVADRISELERQQKSPNAASNPYNQKYTFLDPSKTTRVPNPALKAFQKNAVQSYFERQQSTAKEKEVAKNLINSQQNIKNPPRPQSLPIQSNASKMVIHSRSSLPNNMQLNSLSPNNKSPQQQQQQQLSVMTSPTNQCSTSPTLSNSITVSTTSPSSHSPLSQSATEASTKQTSPSYQATFHQAPTVYNIPMVATAANLSHEHYSRSYNGNICSSNKVVSVEDVSLQSANESGVPPPPPRRSRPMMPVRRTSSASDYAAVRNQNIQKDLLGPIVMGNVISLDDWVPERPPKNPSLRVPSPELPPPPPSTIVEDESPVANQDDPLPPPPEPPELMRHMRQLSEPDSKSATPSRRNSFAGSTSKKPLLRTSTLENPLPAAPPIPKKPTSLETLQPKRSMSSFAKHPPPIIVKPHKISASRKIEPPTSLALTHQHVVPIQERCNDTRPAIRKRLHNAQSPMELTSSKSKIISPPPLKPRIPVHQQMVDTNIPSSGQSGNRLRCNSKASYLPRQSREKLNSDPDHGSYKLTLTSNEDCINENNVFLDDTLSVKCNNLPDVLPVGAKIHSSSPRYGSNNNIHPNYIKSTSSAPIQHAYPMKSMFNFNQNRNSSPSPVSPPYGRCITESQISPKYMSQSNVDLKKTHILANADTNKMAFLENDGVDLTANTQATSRQSPYALRNEFVNRKISFEDRTNTPNQFVPMAVNRSISLTPSTVKDDKLMRKDSLKENIDKITQLQSKLMSAHLSESEKNIANLCRDLNVKNNLSDKQHNSDLIIPVHQLDESKPMEPSSMDETKVTRIDDSPVVEISETTIEPMDGDDGEGVIGGGVHMIQRTEIVLRLNPPTSEAASQTDGYESMSSDCEDYDDNDQIHSNKLQRHAEDLDCEKLSMELISQLSPTDRLHHVFAPKSFKSSSDYVTGLYNPYIAPRIIKKDVSTSTPERSPNGVKSPSATSTSPTNYFTMPEPAKQPKSNTPLRFNREMKTLINGDSCDLTKQKEELVSRISKKLLVLANEQTIIAEESTANDMLGNDVSMIVEQKLRPTDASKFRTYVDDVGHITMLLLSLSGRLAKTENTLHSSVGDDVEKKQLEAKRDRLIEQLEEAKKLKIDIDRRGNLVCKTLEKHLSIEEYADYDYFINMKAKLIVDAREIADKIKLGDEQLCALKDTLVHSEC